MLPQTPKMPLRPRTRLIIAGVIGMLTSLLAALLLARPAWNQLVFFSHFSVIERASLLMKLFSPAICLALVGSWVWIMMRLGERMLIRYARRDEGSTLRQSQYEQSIQGHTRPGQEILLPHNDTRGTIPPLFQLDPFEPIPLDMVPFQPQLNGQKQSTQETESREGKEWEQEKQRSEKRENDIDPEIPSVQTAMVESPDQPVQQPQEQDVLSHTEGMTQNVTAPPSQETEYAQTDEPVTICLLKQVRVWVHAADGTALEVKLRGGENSIRLIVFAYIVWRMGSHVDRDKMLTYVLARGRRHDMTTEQLSEVFDAAKKHLRQDLSRAVNELEKAGHPPKMEDIDFFSTEPGFYWLHPSCRVVDLAEIDTYYQIILIARKEGLLDEKLDGSIPDWVVEACQKLIDAYSGDFLQGLLEKFPDEFGSWVREPLTLYRDRYLDALLILANYESALGRNVLQQEEQRRQAIARGAQYFYDYAMYALNNTWDRKLKFAYRAGKDGERVIMAARAIRRCVVELGKLGNPAMIDQRYLTFKERMSTLSEGNWKPDKDTESDVIAAKSTTGAYRFSSQMADTSHERLK